MTALAPLESRHPRLGQSLWWLWVMRPRCLHAHAAPPACLFARRAVLGRCLSPLSLRLRAPGVELALGAERPGGMSPSPHRSLRHSPLGGWGVCARVCVSVRRQELLWKVGEAGGATKVCNDIDHEPALSHSHSATPLPH